MATSKITKLDLKEGKNEVFLGFENKAWGIYKFEGQLNLKIGDTVDFDVEKKTFDSGSSMNFITIKGIHATQPTTDTPPLPTTEPTVSVTKAGRIGATMTTEARQRAEIDSAISCSNAVYDLIGQGKVDWAQFDEKCDVGYNWLLSNMDETYGAK